jgi:hypothetical protein
MLLYIFRSITILFSLEWTVSIFYSHISSLLLGKNAELCSKVIEVESGDFFVELTSQFVNFVLIFSS